MGAQLDQDTTQRPDDNTLLERNQSALRLAQPEWDGVLAGLAIPPGYRPTAGRDGAATYTWQGPGQGPSGEPAGGWWTGCSVPREASRQMLDTLSPSADVAIYLHPMHPAAITEALTVLGPDRVLVALLCEPDGRAPSPGELALFLSCEDFSMPIADHRLIFAAGIETGMGALADVLSRRPGMKMPGMFVRTSHLTDEAARTTIEACQRVLANVGAERNRRLSELHVRSAGARHGRGTRIVAETASRFVLWHDWAALLGGVAAAVPGFEASYWRRDDPMQADPSYLLSLLVEPARALLVCDFFRAQGGGLLPGSLPVLTWVTRAGELPPFTPAERTAGDLLLLSDPAMATAARKAGWPADRTALASPPARPPTAAPDVPPHLALITDTRPVVIASFMEEFSSLRTVWEQVEANLRRNPLAVGGDIAAFVDRARQGVGVAEAEFPLARMVEEMALPLWQQEIVRLLAEAGVAVRLYGRGWGDIAPPAGVVWGGPVESAADLLLAVGRATGLICPVPTGADALPKHPCTRAGRPVLFASGSAAALVAAARAMVGSGPGAESPVGGLGGPNLSPALLARLLGN